MLISRGGSSYTAAFGFADRRARTPNTVRTESRLGSVSKQFTAMGVLILQARHALSVSDLICRYLPGCPSRWRAITIEELLTRTSGIPDYLDDLSQPWPPAATTSQLIGGFRDAPLHFPPGARMRYSNSGYVLLGAETVRNPSDRIKDPGHRLSIRIHQTAGVGGAQEQACYLWRPGLRRGGRARGAGYGSVPIYNNDQGLRGTA